MDENKIYEALNKQSGLSGIVKYDGIYYIFKWNKGKWELSLAQTILVVEK